MGTVPRQESVPDGSMTHRELFKIALLICLRSLGGARARGARAARGKIKYDTTPRA
jgi:hypothetical protein